MKPELKNLIDNALGLHIVAKQFDIGEVNQNTLEGVIGDLAASIQLVFVALKLDQKNILRASEKHLNKAKTAPKPKNQKTPKPRKSNAEKCFDTCSDYSCVRMNACTGAGKYEDERLAKRREI